MMKTINSFRFEMMVLLVIIFWQNSLRAQNHPQVGKQEINAAFVEVLQLLQPDFYFSKDTAILTANLKKNYLHDKGVSDTVNKQRYLADSAIVRQLNLVKTIAEDMFWSRLASKTAVPISVSDKEAQHYYQQNQRQWLTPGQFSYVQCYVTDTTDAGLKSARQHMLQAYKNLDAFEKAKTPQYTINFEGDITASAGHSLRQLLNQTEEGAISEPLKLESQWVLVLVTKSQPEKVLAFETVKDQCIQKVREQKRLQLESQFWNRIMETYTIK